MGSTDSCMMGRRPCVLRNNCLAFAQTMQQLCKPTNNCINPFNNCANDATWQLFVVNSAAERLSVLSGRITQAGGERVITYWYSAFPTHNLWPKLWPIPNTDWRGESEYHWYSIFFYSAVSSLDNLWPRLWPIDLFLTQVGWGEWKPIDILLMVIS